MFLKMRVTQTSPVKWQSQTISVRSCCCPLQAAPLTAAQTNIIIIISNNVREHKHREQLPPLLCRDGNLLHMLLLTKSSYTDSETQQCHSICQRRKQMCLWTTVIQVHLMINIFLLRMFHPKIRRPTGYTLKKQLSQHVKTAWHHPETRRLKFLPWISRLVVTHRWETGWNKPQLPFKIQRVRPQGSRNTCVLERI